VAAVPALATVLDDESLTARWAAAKSLWAIGLDAAVAVPALVAVLSNDTSWVVRWSAARALGAIAPEADLGPTVSALAGALRDRDSRVCEAAAFALEAIGTRASESIPALARAATGAGESGNEAVCQVIDVGPTAEQLLMNNGWTVRWAAVRALAVVGANRDSVLEPLTVAMQDEQWQVRGVAVLAIGQFDDLDSPSTLAAIQRALDDENPAVRTVAALVNNRLSN
jgi:HEAT repeat protein